MKKIISKPYLIIGGIFVFLILASVFSLYLLTSEKEYKSQDVTYPQSYKDLYNYLKTKNNYNYDALNESQDTLTGGEKSSPSYSKTNLQVLGVDEADIVKTDGNYIYALTGEYLYIVKADEGNLEIVSKVESKEEDEKLNSYFSEMFLKNNYLIVIKNINQYYDFGPMEKNSMEIMPDMYWGRNQELAIVIYDITNKAKPVIANELSQSGSYISSRMVDNYLYVITNHYVYGEIKPDAEETYVPMIKETTKKPIAIDDILIAPNPTSSSYLTITATNINQADKFVSTKAILGSSANMYADTDSIYIAGYGSEQIENTYVSKTNLMKFSANQGEVKLSATGVVNGNILNQFSMDEYAGNFRIVTTSNDYTFIEDNKDQTVSVDFNNKSKTNLYVLDSNLKIISKIEGLAPGETVYSVRFDEEIAYFVTFKRTDPLFVVDLSNPIKPEIKTELKILGFSEYLHVFNEKYLFGLGKDANSEGTVTGMKISMYDIQNKSDVIEKYKQVIGDSYSWSEASYNHKSILISTEKNLIGFPVNDYYVLYKFIDNEGFTKLGQLTMNFEDEYGYYGNIRGLYIDDFFYVVSPYRIKSFNLNDYQENDFVDLLEIKR